MLPSAVIITLAIYWEILGVFINIHCVFSQDILLGLQTEWLFIDIFVFFYSFFLDDARHNSIIWYFVDNIYSAFFSLHGIINPNILVAGKILVLNTIEFSILED